MNLKFWQWDKSRSNANGAKAKPRVRELPQAIGQQMVVRLGEDPDWVWSLKMAYLNDAEAKHRLHFRIFDPAASNGVEIKNYDSLNDHPELVLFSGLHDKNTGEIQFDAR
jgi:hypothetical protein